MKHTKKQRAEIYLKAAELVLTDKDKTGCCNAIRNATGGDISAYYPETRQEYYPELELFNYGSVYWDWNQKERCIGLLLCYEMTKS